MLIKIGSEAVEAAVAVVAEEIMLTAMSWPSVMDVDPEGGIEGEDTGAMEEEDIRIEDLVTHGTETVNRIGEHRTSSLEDPHLIIGAVRQLNMCQGLPHPINLLLMEIVDTQLVEDTMTGVGMVVLDAVGMVVAHMMTGIEAAGMVGTAAVVERQVVTVVMVKSAHPWLHLTEPMVVQEVLAIPMARRLHLLHPGVDMEAPVIVAEATRPVGQVVEGVGGVINEQS